MSAGADQVDHAGWRLVLDLPSEVAESRDGLVGFATATADGRVVAPMRRSRHSATFQARFAASANREFELFVKVIEPPRGWRRFKRLFRPSPARHVVRATRQLAAAGLSAPPVWIYGRDGASGRELIVTSRAEGDGPLRILAALDGAPAAKRATLRALGAEVARLHRSGFVHGDLTPFNIFIVRGATPRFVLLDHERTRRSRFIGRTSRQLRNLVQLGRFNLPGLSRTDRLRTLVAYVASVRPRDRRALMRRVNAMLLRRIRRDGGLEEVGPLPRPLVPSEARA